MSDDFKVYDKIKMSAYRARAALDNNFRPDNTTDTRLVEYFKDCMQHPTAGMITAYYELSGQNINNPKYFFRNRHLALKRTAIQSAFDTFLEKLDRLYPKTLKARNFLIESKRVTLDSCEPVKHNLRRAIFKLFNI